MNKLIIFVAGAIVGYLANGWIEGFRENKEKEDNIPVADLQEAQP